MPLLCFDVSDILATSVTQAASLARTPAMSTGSQSPSTDGAASLGDEGMGSAVPVSTPAVLVGAWAQPPQLDADPPDAGPVLSGQQPRQAAPQASSSTGTVRVACFNVQWMDNLFEHTKPGQDARFRRDNAARGIQVRYCCAAGACWVPHACVRAPSGNTRGVKLMMLAFSGHTRACGAHRQRHSGTRRGRHRD